MFSLSRFKHMNFKGDLFGGVTTAIISLPLALAFGVASGAGAEAGMWGAILVGLFAALFGGSTSLISEPTGPMTVIMTAVLTTMVSKYPEAGPAMAFTVVMMAGAFQILLGTLKLGKYVTLMPYSVVSGFMSGIGVILIILQLAPLLGHQAPPGGVPGTLAAFPELFLNLHISELFLGLLSDYSALKWYLELRPKVPRGYWEAQGLKLRNPLLPITCLHVRDSIR